MENGLPMEDALAYLPCSRIAAYRKGDVIYDHHNASGDIFLVIDGKVKISRVAETGHQVIIDIYLTDEFFGESAFLSLPERSEQAVALENTKVMMWPVSEVAALILKQPKLGIALVQIAIQRNVESVHRIESFTGDNIARRLARSLIRFSERLGEPEQDGVVRMVPFTHELLAQYVGTSREIVTHWMARFRREGYIRYSRKSIVLFRRKLQNWLREQALEAGTQASGGGASP